VPATTPAKKRAVLVIDRQTGQVVHRVDVDKKSDRDVDRVIAGMSINLDSKRFRLEDSKFSRKA